MSTEFKLFRNSETGKEGLYPAHFASEPGFTEIDPDTGACLDCQYQEEGPVDEATPADVDSTDFIVNPEYIDSETEDN